MPCSSEASRTIAAGHAVVSSSQVLDDLAVVRQRARQATPVANCKDVRVGACAKRSQETAASTEVPESQKETEVGTDLGSHVADGRCFLRKAERFTASTSKAPVPLIFIAGHSIPLYSKGCLGGRMPLIDLVITECGKCSLHTLESAHPRPQTNAIRSCSMQSHILAVS